MTTSTPTLRTSDNFPICLACGTQYPNPKQSTCPICLDPRQFVPPTGQEWTTLSAMRAAGHHNVWSIDPVNPKIHSFQTEPKFAIGQRAMLIQTPHGNIMWDMITLLDQATVSKIKELGGLRAIVISHPHYYTTIHDWAATFPDAEIILGDGDQQWLVDDNGRNANSSISPRIRFLTNLHTLILPDVTAILSGGHFPGSLCLHWASQLFIADTIFTVPSARNPEPGTPGVISYTFWYSVPNRIPLSPSEVLQVWLSVRDLDWHSTFGAFEGMDVRSSDEEIRKRGTGGVKGRMLESVRIFVRGMGWVDEEGQIQREWNAVRLIEAETTKGSDVAPVAHDAAAATGKGDGGGAGGVIKTDFAL